MSFDQEQLSVFNQTIKLARAGDEDAIELVRKVMEAVGRDSPVPELIEIADFTAGFLRRHIQDHVNRN